MPKLDYSATVKINGKPFSIPQLEGLVEIIVDTDCFLPAMFEITLEDDYDAQKNSLKYADSNQFTLGAPVEISMDMYLDVERSQIKSVLIDGEITSIEPQLKSDGRALYLVRGYDKSHRLMRGEKTRTFGDGKSASIGESDIVRKIAQEAGLNSVIDSSGISSLTYYYVMQYNQTDWDFLWSRARRVGYQVYVEGSKLYYQKANHERGTSSTPIELEWRKDLTSFEPRLSIMGQASEAVVSGWDSNTKQKVLSKCASGSLSNSPQTGITEKPEAALKKSFSPAKVVVVDEPGYTSGMAKTIADAELSAHENNYIQASGTLQYGDPRVLAGRKIKIKGAGQKFSGTYYVTRARHSIGRGRYSVQFDLSGSTPHTLYGMLQAGQPAADHRKVEGPVIGVVTSLDDPEKQGRVQVKFPWMPDSEAGGEFASNWARVTSPGAGKDRGMLFLPEINDEVLVAFEHGDIQFPYILGGLWNKKDLPPKGTEASVNDQTFVNQRVIRSRSGHLIVLNDKDGKEQILIQDKTAQNSILIDSSQNNITIKSKADLVVQAGGKFTVNATGDITLDTKGKVQINAQQSFAVDAKQQASAKVLNNQLTLSTSGAELSGTKVEIKGNAMTSVSSTAVTEVKGALVKIN